MKIAFACSQCGGIGSREAGAVNRAKKRGPNLYCSRTCAGRGRRNNKTIEQKRREKKEYDALYRLFNADTIKEKKASYYKLNRDPERERVYRKSRMAKHVAYCATPKYKAKKRQYDIQRRGMDYGDFAECHRLLIDLEREIRTQMPRYEIYKLNGRYERLRQRRRDHD